MIRSYLHLIIILSILTFVNTAHSSIITDFSAIPNFGDPPLNVQFSLSAYDDTDTTINTFLYEIDFEADGTFDYSSVGSLIGISESYTYTMVGVYDPIGRATAIVDGAEISGMSTVQINTSPIPEPATMFLFGIGLLGLSGVSRRKK